MRGRHPGELHFLEGEMEAQRKLMTCLRVCSKEVTELGLEVSQPGTVEHLGRSQGRAWRSGLWHRTSGMWQGPGSCLTGSRPSASRRPVDRPEQTGAAHGSRQREWLGGAPCRVCSWPSSPWADSRGTAGPHGGGQVVQLLYWSRS